MSGKISQITPGSIAEEIGLAVGDILLSINGEPVDDLIDYNYLSDDEYLELEIKKPSGEIWLCELDKYDDEELGLAFESNVFNGIRSCCNHCLFCFIDQLHPQPRPSLLLKDDDYRMSFLEGNFITCTNMREEDYRRIGELRLSPLYISVHTIDPMLRQKMLGAKAPSEIMLTLQRLISLGCTLHTQIVLCPGINDGEYLHATIDALYAMRARDGSAPGVASVAVVPVGLTRFQKNPELRLFTTDEAAAVIDYIEARQRRYAAESGNSFVYAADELYIKAGREFPLAAVYGDFAQLENGVGMAALFRGQWEQVRHKIPSQAPRGRIAVATGVNGARVLRPVLDEISRRCHGMIELIEVENTFFGPSVTATGLLTGSCLTAAIPAGVYGSILIPANMLKFDEDIFLDDMTVDQLAEKLQAELRIVEPEPAALLAAIFEEDNGKEYLR